MTGQLDCAFQQSTIHLVGDEPLTECRQRALRKRRFILPNHAQHHLPTRIDDRQLDGLSVGRTRVGLKKDDHREQRRRHRLLALARGPVHPLELRLKRLVEQLVPVQAQERVQLARARHSTHQVLLAPRQRSTRIPSCHGLRPPCGEGLRTKKRSHRGSSVDPLAQAIRNAQD
jgi:hypothetical protein